MSHVRFQIRNNFYSKKEILINNTVIVLLIWAIGKFLTFVFRKNNYETVIFDIFGLGNFALGLSNFACD